MLLSRHHSAVQIILVLIDIVYSTYIGVCDHVKITFILPVHVPVGKLLIFF